jgi:predicted metal-binding membrane protein
MMPDARERASVRNAMLLISAIAWGVLLLAPGETLTLAHHHHTAIAPASLAAGWALMLVAMMSPALIPAVGHLRLRSFTHRRARTVALFALAYAAIWMAIGLVLIAIAIPTAIAVARFAPHPPSYAAAMVGIGVACVWQCSPMKQRCLNRCHAHGPIAAFGAAADVSALRFGAIHGMWCAGACWALMLIPLLLPQGHMLAMAVVTAVIFSERLEQPRTLRWRVRAPAKAVRIVVAQTRLRLRTVS